MSQIEQRNWELGWIPSDDQINGRKNGLLRMDNCSLDDNGILSLTRAISKINATPFADFVNKAYSKIISGTKNRYVHLNNGNILKDTGAGLFLTTVLSGGVTTSAFGSAIGQVLAVSGTQKKKDDGSTIRDLGIPVAGSSVTLATVVPSTKEAVGTFSSYTLIEGTNLVLTGFVQFDTSSTTFRGVVGVTESMDLTDLGGTGKDTPDDTWKFDIRIGDTNKLQKVRIEYILTGTTTNPDEYYFAEFNEIDIPGWFNQGINAWSTINMKRSDFVKFSQGSTKTWKDVIGIRVEVVAMDVITILFDTMRFIGGTTGPLNGRYTYYQVNVFNSGKYLGKSKINAESLEIEAKNQALTVTGVNMVSPTINEVWHYRKRISDPPQDTWYRVKVLTSGFATPYTDNVSDEDAEFTNERIDFYIDLPPNNIIDMIDGLYFDRAIYITSDAIYPSKRLNIDAIDTRFILKSSGDPTESNLWSRKVSNSSILIGTTNDIYELSGSGEEFLDGSIDFILRPLGIKQPPISQAATVVSGSVIYMAHDGWRILTGSSSQRIVGGMDLLFKGFTRYTILPVNIAGNNTVRYDCVIAKGKLWTTVTLSDSSRRCYVYDLEKQYWYPYFTDPLSLFVEEDGILLGGYGGGSGNHLRIMDTGILLDGTTKQQINILSSFDDAGMPNRRKDVEMFEIFADTGGDNVNIKIFYDGSSSSVDLGNFAFSGPTVRQIAINNTLLNLKKSFQIQITDVATAGVSAFKLFYFRLDFDPRPEQLNFLHIRPHAFGISGRKRLYNFSMLIDTLGSDVTFTPIVDAVDGTPATVNRTGKNIFTHIFTDEQVGVEIGGKLQATGNNVFEFYELLPPKALEQLPDPTRFFRIPNNNLGSFSRKRIIRYAIIIDTFSTNVTLTPIVDGANLAGVTINTTGKRTAYVTFTSETIGIEIGATLSGTIAFEFYGVLESECLSETLPLPAKFLTVPTTNLGSFSRKRIITYALVIDTKGFNVTLTPIVDGVSQTISTINTTGKRTYIHYFTSETIGVDISATLSGANDFEFYALNPEEIISEKLPAPAKFLRIPNNNLGTDNRKRIMTFAIVIDTKSVNVTFTPIVDGSNQIPLTINTTGKLTVIYYFTSEIIGTDIGGTLSGTTEFEYYGINYQETISEKLPAPTKHLIIPATSFGIAAKKRIRTIPLVINTRGFDVTFTPILDGINGATSTINTGNKLTAFHYFLTDVFPVDIGGILSGANFFEFYEMAKPEIVQVLPPGKRFDQIGPVEFDRLAKLLRLRLRLVTTTATLNYKVFAEDTQITSGSLTTTPNIDKPYEVRFIKTMKAQVVRIELDATAIFHRLNSELWYNLSGGETSVKKVKLP